MKSTLCKYTEPPLPRQTFPVGQIIMLLLLSGIVILWNGCSKGNKHHAHYVSDASASAILSTNAAAGETLSAGNFLGELQMQNRLPGVSKDDHGEMTSTEVNFSATEKYPISRTFFVVIKGDRLNSKFNYTLVRQDKKFEWQLEKAWRTDSEGKTIKEWPVK